MIALTPPEEPLQSIEIVSGTDWDTAEPELEVEDEVLQSAVETLADLKSLLATNTLCRDRTDIARKIGSKNH